MLISVAVCMLFLIIAQNEGISQKELGDRLYVEKSTTAKDVNHLESKDYMLEATEHGL